MGKALIYKKEGTALFPNTIQELREIAVSLNEHVPPELVKRLHSAIDDLESVCKATTPLFRGSDRVGWGMKESEKNLAIDRATSILKEMKKVKGW